jgi:hypothetical protein
LKEYRRLKKNAKSKIKRVKENFGSMVAILDEEKKGKKIVDLEPRMVRTEELVKIPDATDFSSRKEFNQWKREIQDFTNRSKKNYQFKKNQYNIVGSERLLNQIEHDNKEAQRLADKERAKIEDLPAFADGKKLVETVSQRIAISGDTARKTGIYRPTDFDFDKIRDYASLLDKSETVYAKAQPEYYDLRKQKMRDNFIELLKGQFHSDADALIDKIKNIPPDYFYEMYIMFEEFDFNSYDSEGNENLRDMDALEQMLSYVEAFEEGAIDFTLKSFPNG